ncbi:MAG: hypothetical protein MTP17_03040 [Candidatus Midichloria sp.]|nr:MAG: hypothetical protein MTP17_03040 [Candidatus Midichloria sp.]
MLPITYINIKLGDLVRLNLDNRAKIRVTDVDIRSSNCLRLHGFSEEFEVMSLLQYSDLIHEQITFNLPSKIKVELLDIPSISLKLQVLIGQQQLTHP